MAQVTLMSWNLGALDAARASQAGMAYVQYLASAMEVGKVALAAFSGIRSDLGEQLGAALAMELYNRGQGQASWNHLACPPLGAGRGEQYLFVWNLAAIEARPFPGTTDYWQWDYPLPGGQEGVYGFPRSTGQSSDLPPMRMLFRPAGSEKLVSVAIFDGPDWLLGDAAGVAAQAACGNLAIIPDFDQGDGGVIMGTFHVPHDDDVSVAGSNGAAVFAALAGPGGKYVQAIRNTRSVLADQPLVAITLEDAEPQSADTLFFRADGPGNGVACASAGIADLLRDALGTMDDQGNFAAAPMGLPLALVEAAAAGADGVSAGPDGSYGKLDDAFAVYRALVGDHLPALVTLTC